MFPRVALTGGIACGKSLLATYLRARGVDVLDADDVVHELEAPGGAAVAPIVAHFGPSVRAPDGGIDRPALAARVFADPAARRTLESLLFPSVRSRLQSHVQSPITNHAPRPTPHEPRPTPHAPRTTPHAPRATNHEPRTTNHEPRATPHAPRPLAIIPLLFESHWESDYDIILCIASPVEMQISRMMQTRGYTRAQAEARLAAQMPVAEKAARAHYVVRNESTPENLEAEAERLVAWLAAQRK